MLPIRQRLKVCKQDAFGGQRSERMPRGLPTDRSTMKLPAFCTLALLAGFVVTATDQAGNEATRLRGTGVIRAVCGSLAVVLGEECDGDYRCNPRTCKCAAPVGVGTLSAAPAG